MNKGTTYKVEFDRSGKKHLCPDCGKKTFVRYVYVSDGTYLPDEFGKCDREINCGHFQQPGPDILYNTTSKFNAGGHEQKTPVHVPPPVPDFIPVELFEKYNSLPIENNLHEFFRVKFGDTITERLKQKYKYSSAAKGVFTGAMIFWQIDKDQKIRSGKIIQYDKETGRRRKDIQAACWVHTSLNTPEKTFSLVQCFFGEHLLSEPDIKPIAIVESEKTAMIASVYFPQFIWLATNGKNGCKWTEYHVCRVLRGRKVVLFPDLGANNKTGESCFQYWNKRAAILRGFGLTVSVSNFLENNQKIDDDDRKAGSDLADFLLRFDYMEFVKPETKKKSGPEDNFKQPEIISNSEPVITDEIETNPPVESWNIDELEKYFSNIRFPDEIKLSPHETITHPKRFIDSHLSTCKQNEGKRVFIPYYERLLKVKELINTSTENKGSDPIMINSITYEDSK